MDTEARNNANIEKPLNTRASSRICGVQAIPPNAVWPREEIRGKPRGFCGPA